MFKGGLTDVYDLVAYLLTSSKQGNLKNFTNNPW